MAPHPRRNPPASGALIGRDLQARKTKGRAMIKAILWFIAIVFIIGLLVVFGILDLIF